MKNFIFTFLVLIISGTCVFSQHQAADVFKKDKIVWYGLDFSNAKFIGQFDQAAGLAPANASDLKHDYIPAWNSLILSEPNRYDIRKTFRKTRVFNDLSGVRKNNEKMDESLMMSYNAFRFDDANTVITNIVELYQEGKKAEGIGVVFIVEYFNRIDQEAAVYVTFFDIATQKVLFYERLLGNPRGIGLRNYWAGAVRDILIQIERNAYDIWRKNHGSK